MSSLACSLHYLNRIYISYIWSPKSIFSSGIAQLRYLTWTNSSITIIIIIVTIICIFIFIRLRCWRGWWFSISPFVFGRYCGGQWSGGHSYHWGCRDYRAPQTSPYRYTPRVTKHPWKWDKRCLRPASGISCAQVNCLSIMATFTQSRLRFLFFVFTQPKVRASKLPPILWQHLDELVSGFFLFLY